MNSKDRAKIIKMEHAYENYISKVLEILKKKMELLIEYRLALGEKKLTKLKEK